MDEYCDKCENSKFDVGCQPCIECDNAIGGDEVYDLERCERCDYALDKCKWTKQPHPMKQNRPESFAGCR